MRNESIKKVLKRQKWTFEDLGKGTSGVIILRCICIYNAQITANVCCPNSKRGLG